MHVPHAFKLVALLSADLLLACSSDAGTQPQKPTAAASAPISAGHGAVMVAPTGAPGSAVQTMLIVSAPPLAAVAMGGDAGDTCKTESAAAQQVPVDVFMMVDQSLSMVAPELSGETRWGAVINALSQFVQAPQSAGLGVGVQYFGLSIAGISCDPADYAVPEVEIAPLPGNAQALIDSFSAHLPSSVTPTAPALQGAIAHAQAFKAQNPSHVVTVLLVTDGEPDTCGIDLLGDTVNAAAQGFMGNPAISTYVLGVGGSLDALNQIAQAGGTKNAYIVDDSANTSDKIVGALNQIRGQVSLPCEFQVPAPEPGQQFDFSKVNLTYTTSAGQSSIIGYSQDASKSNTAALAWRYDNPGAPAKIILGDATCNTVASQGGKIEIALHCPTVPVALN